MLTCVFQLEGGFCSWGRRILEEHHVGGPGCQLKCGDGSSTLVGSCLSLSNPARAYLSLENRSAEVGESPRGTSLPSDWVLGQTGHNLNSSMAWRNDPTPELFVVSHFFWNHLESLHFHSDGE